MDEIAHLIVDYVNNSYLIRSLEPKAQRMQFWKVNSWFTMKSLQRSKPSGLFKIWEGKNSKSKIRSYCIINRALKYFRNEIILGRRHFLIILYDILYLNGECLLRKPLNERKRLLALSISIIPNYIQISPLTIIDLRQNYWYQNIETFRELYLECLDRRDEGLIIKNADSFYIPGDRNNWWKLKKDYIEGFGDTADFAVVGATKSENSGGMWDTFIVACLTNKTILENDPINYPTFQAIFTVSLGLTRSELELLQAVLESRNELDIDRLGYDCQFARGFNVQRVNCWLNEPLVFELLGSGFIRVNFLVLSKVMLR